LKEEEDEASAWDSLKEAAEMDVESRLGHSSSSQRTTWGNSQWSSAGTGNRLPSLAHPVKKEKKEENLFCKNCFHYLS